MLKIKIILLIFTLFSYILIGYLYFNSNNYYINLETIIIFISNTLNLILILLFERYFDSFFKPFILIGLYFCPWITIITFLYMYQTSLFN